MPFRVRIKDPTIDATYTASVDDDNKWTVEEMPDWMPDDKALKLLITTELSGAAQDGAHKVGYLPWPIPAIHHAFALVEEWPGSEIISQLPEIEHEVDENGVPRVY